MSDYGEFARCRMRLLPFCKVGGLHRAPSTRVGPAYDYNYSYGDFDPAVDCSAYQYIAEPSAALECDGTRAEGGCRDF